MIYTKFENVLGPPKTSSTSVVRYVNNDGLKNGFDSRNSFAMSTRRSTQKGSSRADF